MADGADDLQERLGAVKQLLDLFRFERFTYLGVNIFALLMLLGSAAVLLFRHNDSGLSLYAVITALFGSSGLLTFSIVRLLHMWDQAFGLLQNELVPPGRK